MEQGYLSFLIQLTTRISRVRCHSGVVPKCAEEEEVEEEEVVEGEEEEKWNPINPARGRG